MNINWRIIFQTGLISGIVLLYMGMVGLLGAFIDREVVKDTYTLAQLILFLVPFATGYITAQRLMNTNGKPLEVLIGALVAGLLSVVPTALIILLSQSFEISDILVSLNRDWLTMTTFDNRENVMLGVSLLAGFNAGASLIGAVLRLLPDKLRKSLFYGLIAATLISVFGRTLSLVLQDPLKGWLLSRETVKQFPAAVVYGVCLGLSFIWQFLVADRMRANGEKSKEHDRTTNPQQNLITWLVFGVILLILPLVVGRVVSLTLFTVGIYVLMGLGLNISIGLAGMLDLGYVTSFAVGAYTMAVFSSTGIDGFGAKLTAWLTSPAVGMTPEGLWFVPIVTNFWFVLLLSMLMAMLVGFLFSLPILKMRGDYLAIATLGFGQIIGALVGSDWLAPTLGGAQGIQDVPRPWVGTFELANPENLYYLALAACALVFYSVTRLANSRTGRQWMAIREDEDVAAAMGIDVPRSKMLAFTLAAAAGGLAGGIFTTQVTTAFPNSFEALVSFNVLALIIVGGLGSNRGIILGALFLVGLPDLLREFSDFRFLIYGILLIVMMLYRPEGLLPSTLAVRELRKEDDSVPAGEAS